MNLNYFSQRICINDTLVFRTRLGFIRVTEVLDISGFRYALFVQNFVLLKKKKKTEVRTVLLSCICFQDGETGRREVEVVTR